jgi:hypothetical protein
MNAHVRMFRDRLDGLVFTPTILWMAGVPFGVGCLFYVFVTRGR